jgi:hypothetical protein
MKNCPGSRVLPCLKSVMRLHVQPRETKLVCEGVDSTLMGEAGVGAWAESMIHCHVCSVIKRGVTWMINSLTFREGSS